MKKLNLTFGWLVLIAAQLVIPTLSASDHKTLFHIKQLTDTQIEKTLTANSISELSEQFTVGTVNHSAFKELAPGNAVWISFSEQSQEHLLRIESIEKHMTNITTYLGQIDDDEQSQFIISASGQDVMGSFKFNGSVYILEPSEKHEKHHIMHKLNNGCSYTN